MHDTSADVDRADLRRRCCGGATGSATGCCGRRWSRWPIRSDAGTGRAPVRHGDAARPSAGDAQRREEEPDELQGLAREGLLRGPRRPQGRRRRRDQEGVPQARPGAAPGPQPGQQRGRGAVQGGLRGLRRALRRRSGARVRRGALAVRRGRPAPGAGGPGGGGGQPFDLGDLFGGAGRPPAAPARRPRRPASAACSAASAAAPRPQPGGVAARPRAGRRGRGDARFADAVRGATRAATLQTPGHVRDLRAAAAPSRAPSRTPARPATAPAVTSRSQGAFAFTEPCRDCQGVGSVVDDQCPSAAAPAGPPRPARSTSASRPASPTASGSGWPARASRASAAARPATCSSLVHVAPHTVFGRKGDDLTLTVPVTFAEAALGADAQGARPSTAPVTLGAAGHPAAAARCGCAAAACRGKGRRATCWSRSRSPCPAAHARGSARRRDARRGDRRGPAAADRPRRCRPEASDDADRATATQRRLPVPSPRTRPVFVISVAAELAGHAPADAAPVRPARPGQPGRTAGRRPPLLRARRRAAPRGAAAVAGGGRQPRRHQADHRAREPGRGAAGAGARAARGARARGAPADGRRGRDPGGLPRATWCRSAGTARPSSSGARTDRAAGATGAEPARGLRPPGARDRACCCAASRAISARLAGELHPDLDGAAYGLLALLQDAGPLRASDLVTRLGLDKSTVSRQVASLVELGLVERTRRPGRRPRPGADAVGGGVPALGRDPRGAPRPLGGRPRSWPAADVAAGRAAGSPQPHRRGARGRGEQRPAGGPIGRPPRSAPGRRPG